MKIIEYFIIALPTTFSFPYFEYQLHFIIRNYLFYDFIIFSLEFTFNLAQTISYFLCHISNFIVGRVKEIRYTYFYYIRKIYNFRVLEWILNYLIKSILSKIIPNKLPISMLPYIFSTLFLMGIYRFWLPLEPFVFEFNWRGQIETWLKNVRMSDVRPNHTLISE